MADSLRSSSGERSWRNVFLGGLPLDYKTCGAIGNYNNFNFVVSVYESLSEIKVTGSFWEFKKTSTALAMGTSLINRFNDYYNGCAHAL